MRSGRRRTRVLRMNTDITTLDKVTNEVLNLRLESRSGYVCLSNVHMCMEVFDNPDFSEVVNQADFVLPDGLPVAWAQRLLGSKDGCQIRGQDLMNRLCKLSEDRSLKIGLYGGASDNVLLKVIEALKLDFPNVQIVYSHCPPFRPLTEAEDDQVVRRINSAEVDFLFVGIGCPKQERWMAEHKSSINAVMFGVGAAFDFISGSKKHAPIWMQRVGMEWAFRLGSEPGRLWRRYLQQNPRFIYYLVRQLLGDRSFM